MNQLFKTSLSSRRQIDCGKKIISLLKTKFKKNEESKLRINIKW